MSEDERLTACILVCCHKDDIRAEDYPYVPIHVGKALSSVELGIVGDDTGDNISRKNASYCELTGLYWAWRNTDTDIVGLCHYRRYFDFHDRVPSFSVEQRLSPSLFGTTDLSIPMEGEEMRRVAEGSVITSTRIPLDMTPAAHYTGFHYAKDLTTLRGVIRDMGEERYVKAFDKVMYHSFELCPYNMFVMRRSDFDHYCSWLFAVLGEVEKRIDISRYDSYQTRIFGFMAERLLNIYLVAEDKHTIELPVITFMDGETAQHGLIERFCLRMWHLLRGKYVVWRSRLGTKRKE